MISGTNRSSARGVLLLDALAALVILSTAVLALGEALSSVRRSTLRQRREQAIVSCAESRLAQTLIGTGAPGFPCDPDLRVQMDSALSGGDMEQVTWHLSFVGDPEERFTAVRCAR